MEELDDLALACGLVNVDLDIQRLCISSNLRVELIESLLAVDGGLSRAEQVEAGAVEDEDLHEASLPRAFAIDSRGASTPASGLPRSESRTNLTPLRCFLSRAQPRSSSSMLRRAETGRSRADRTRRCHSTTSSVMRPSSRARCAAAIMPM